VTILLESAPVEGASLVARRLSNHHVRSAEDLSVQFVAPAPLPLYTIALHRLAELGLASQAAAERFGWRYIVYEGEEASLVDLLDRPGGGLQAYAVARGEAAAQFVEAAILAERMLDDDDYQVRILDMPLVSLSALWFDRPGASLMLDLNDPEIGLQPLEEAFGRAQARARIRLSAVSSDMNSSEDGG
jgi:hypothetical protein